MKNTPFYKIKIGIYATLFLNVFTSVTIAQKSVKEIEKYWVENDFKSVIAYGGATRDSIKSKGLHSFVPYIDNMILSSMAMIDSYNPKACSLFKSFISDPVNHKYKYLDEKYSFKTFLHCGIDADTNEANYNYRPLVQALKRELIEKDFTLSHFPYALRAALLKGDFKEYWVRRGYSQMDLYLHDLIEQLGESSLNASAPPDYSQFSDSLVGSIQNRKIELTAKKDVPRMIRHYFGNVQSIKSDHFVLVAALGSHYNLEKIKGLVEKVYNYFCRVFIKSPPKEFIVIHLLENYESLPKYLRVHYYLNSGNDILGYSNFIDKSIVAWLPHSESIGTIKHELVHLLFENEFDYLPYWFEEGFASLTEESIFDNNNNLVGLTNWRSAVLTESRQSISLRSLFECESIDDLTLDYPLTTSSFLFYTRMRLYQFINDYSWRTHFGSRFSDDRYVSNLNHIDDEIVRMVGLSLEKIKADSLKYSRFDTLIRLVEERKTFDEWEHDINLDYNRFRIGEEIADIVNKKIDVFSDTILFGGFYALKDRLFQRDKAIMFLYQNTHPVNIGGTDYYLPDNSEAMVMTNQIMEQLVTSCKYALARNVILYAQDKNLLLPLFDAFAKRETGLYQNSNFLTTEEIILNTFNLNVYDLNAQFYKWFDAKGR